MGFFFFFFNEKLGNNKIVLEAFNRICFEKLLAEGYCDMNSVLGKPKINKTEMAAKLSLIHSPLEKLYKSTYPKNEQEMGDKLLPVLEEIVQKEIKLDEFSFFAVVYYIFQFFGTYEKKMDITKQLFEQWKIVQDKTALADIDIKVSGGIVYDANTIDLRIVNSINQYIDLLDEMPDDEYKLFYRGHSRVSYQLAPSLFRDKTWVRNEKKMYQELQINCPDDFSGLDKHIEILAEMQHYGLPTRLLDVTLNPLIALYFACEDNAGFAGEVIIFAEAREEIKYPQSDTIAVLSSLPAFTFEEQRKFYDESNDASLTKEQFNVRIERLVHEVRMERPGFKSTIKQQDLRECLFCIPTRNNKRLDKQEGAFIVCGLLGEVYGKKKNNTLAGLRIRSEVNKKIICIVEQKGKIMKQLNLLGINKSRVYPEIDDVADYIKNHVDEI